ncbi:MAG TPA: type II toxin-antitoxin system PemK/MazF family toxin [Terriglobales bacterium]|nr:type II toxin-antitoxin system PemK/MazF family toxin [Terriglobales bacterium]
MPKVAAGRYPRRGEVYWLRLDKDRTGLIISSDVLNRHAFDVCIVPITSLQHGRFALRVAIKAGDGGLSRDSWAKCDQVSTLSKQSIIEHNSETR